MLGQLYSCFEVRSTSTLNHAREKFVFPAVHLERLPKHYTFSPLQTLPSAQNSSPSEKEDAQEEDEEDEEVEEVEVEEKEGKDDGGHPGWAVHCSNSSKVQAPLAPLF